MSKKVDVEESLTDRSKDRALRSDSGRPGGEHADTKARSRDIRRNVEKVMGVTKRALNLPEREHKR